VTFANFAGLRQPKDRRERSAGKKAEEAEEEGKGNVGGAEAHDE
jgi:hypothetical protein